MTEMFVTARDGYVAGNVAAGKATSRSGVPVPAYARPDAGTRRRSSRGLADLVNDLSQVSPGMLGKPEFPN